MRALLLVALAGCYGVDSIEGTWVPVEEVDGELSCESSAAPQPLAGTDVLRVATYNLMFESDRVKMLAEIAASPDLSRADVILAQEVEDRDVEPTNTPRMFGEALAMSYVFAPARIARGHRHGTAIFSRYPITNARVMKLPLGNAAWNEDTRNAVIADIDVGGRIVTVVSIHLDVRLNVVDRIRQLHPVVTQVPEAAAIGGDYNTNPWAWVGSTVPLTSTEAIVGQDQATVIDDYMGDLGFTIPIGPHESTFNLALLDYMRLDNVYVRGWEVIAQGIARDVEGSDHWPVWVDLKLVQ